MIEWADSTNTDDQTYQVLIINTDSDKAAGFGVNLDVSPNHQYAVAANENYNRSFNGGIHQLINGIYLYDISGITSWNPLHSSALIRLEDSQGNSFYHAERITGSDNLTLKTAVLAIDNRGTAFVGNQTLYITSTTQTRQVHSNHIMICNDTCDNTRTTSALQIQGHDQFAHALAVSGDGALLVASYQDENSTDRSILGFKRNNNTYEHTNTATDTITKNIGDFAQSLRISPDGKYLFVSAVSDGHVYVYQDFTESTFSIINDEQKITAITGSQHFGEKLILTPNGATLGISYLAKQADLSYRPAYAMYQYQNNQWVHTFSIVLPLAENSIISASLLNTADVNLNYFVARVSSPTSGSSDLKLYACNQFSCTEKTNYVRNIKEFITAQTNRPTVLTGTQLQDLKVITGSILDRDASHNGQAEIGVQTFKINMPYFCHGLRSKKPSLRLGFSYNNNLKFILHRINHTVIHKIIT